MTSTLHFLFNLDILYKGYSLQQPQFYNPQGILLHLKIKQFFGNDMKVVDFIAHLFLGDISKLIPFKLYRRWEVIIINVFLSKVIFILNNKP